MYTDQKNDNTKERTISTIECVCRSEVFEQLHFVLGGLRDLFGVELIVDFEIGRVARRGDDGFDRWFDCSSQHVSPRDAHKPWFTFDLVATVLR